MDSSTIQYCGASEDGNMYDAISIVYHGLGGWRTPRYQPVNGALGNSSSSPVSQPLWRANMARNLMQHTLLLPHPPRTTDVNTGLQSG